MSSNLAERLKVERHRRFVGRSHELDVFRTVLSAEELPVLVLHLYGPGGVGKTSLLREFIRICEQQQIPAIYIDARNIEPSPESFLSALGAVMGMPANTSPVQQSNATLERQVILIDTYETLQPIDLWLHETFLPQLSANTLTVLSGRQPPDPMWRSDSGWQALMHLMPLRNLSPDESRSYLTQRAVPLSHHQAVLDFTHSYPLALSLVADVFAQRQQLSFEPEILPDVVKTLMARFVREVPSVAHRMALEASAIARITTEALLSELLDLPDVHELFEWLHGLSFMETGAIGLFPHDLARDVLSSDLRWRAPDWYSELHQRARHYYSHQLGKTQGQEQHRVLFDYIFLHRDNPAVHPRFTWQETSSIKIDHLQNSDVPVLLTLVATHEGETSAQLATHWFARQPQGVLVFRNQEQQPIGFVAMIALHQASAEDLAVDPAATAAWRYLEQQAPLRSGEGATFFRFWMARDTYQAVSPTQSLIFITFVQHHRNTPGLAFTFFACADPDYWAAMFAYADLQRLPEADFAVDDRQYGVYGHDWRVVSPAAWQELLAQREIATSVQVLSSPQVVEPILVLSYPDFVSAVRDALRHFSRPTLLHHNPLLRSRLVVERTGTSASVVERVITLQSFIKDAAESLQSSPRQAKCYRAIYYTYLKPAPTQEQASELLELPFSTFRRHLKVGIAQVTEILWHHEIGK